MSNSCCLASPRRLFASLALGWWCGWLVVSPGLLAGLFSPHFCLSLSLVWCCVVWCCPLRFHTCGLFSSLHCVRFGARRVLVGRFCLRFWLVSSLPLCVFLVLFSVETKSLGGNHLQQVRQYAEVDSLREFAECCCLGRMFHLRAKLLRPSGLLLPCSQPSSRSSVFVFSSFGVTGAQPWHPSAHCQKYRELRRPACFMLLSFLSCFVHPRTGSRLRLIFWCRWECPPLFGIIDLLGADLSKEFMYTHVFRLLWLTRAIAESL